MGGADGVGSDVGAVVAVTAGTAPEAGGGGGGAPVAEGVEAGKAAAGEECSIGALAVCCLVWEGISSSSEIEASIASIGFSRAEVNCSLQTRPNIFVASGLEKTIFGATTL